MIYIVHCPVEEKNNNKKTDKVSNKWRKEDKPKNEKVRKKSTHEKKKRLLKNF